VAECVIRFYFWLIQKGYMKVIADDKIPFLRGVLEPFAEVVYVDGASIDASMVKDADALLVRTRTRCHADLLQGSRVRFIGTATIGFDHIDDVFCHKHGISWYNVPGCNALSVQQYVACALVHLSNMFDFDLRQRTLGIIGVGHTGSAVMNIAEQMGMRIVLHDLPRMVQEGPCGFVSLDGVLREADIITFHVPLDMEPKYSTYHMADDVFFSKVNEGTFVVNTSRGEVIDSMAMEKALNGGRLRGVVLDVWENEPDISIPLIRKAVIATPHIAGYSLDGKVNATQQIVRAFCNHFQLPEIVIDKEKLPVPDNVFITLDGKNKTTEEVIAEAVFQTYNLQKDHTWLQQNPLRFEHYRSHYPLRREYHAYTLRVRNMLTDGIDALHRIGFNIQKMP
jgi:erythronate-4-phosphate dehydrogenase